MSFFKKKSFRINVLTASLFAAFNIHAADPAPSTQKILDLIEAQQKELDALKAQLKQSEQRTEQKVEAVSTMVEKQQTATPSSWFNKSRIGGYGEMHYNNLKNNGAKGDLKEIDFHRFVLYFGHHFSDKISFHSELELEHAVAGEGKVGYSVLEQAYLDFQMNPDITIRGGLFLMPIGMVNETHEPNVFYGTERNPIENKIIPTTWFEGGVDVIGKIAAVPGLQYDLALHSGLAVDSKYNIRDGRQRVGHSKSNSLATTARLKYTGVKGLEVAASLYYQDDITQKVDPKAGSATLAEVHADYQIQNFRIKGLYAQWKLEGDGPKAAGKDKQYGWYIEPSYKISEQVGVFARYNEWDNGAAAGKESRYRQYDVGVSYWAHPNVVIKADYQHQEGPAGSDLYKGFNLGLGYQFF
jgi:hypothetical protein